MSSSAKTRAMPPAAPRMAPARAGRICAVASPTLTCCGVAARALATAVACRVSSTVAHAIGSQSWQVRGRGEAPRRAGNQSPILLWNSPSHEEFSLSLTEIVE